MKVSEKDKGKNEGKSKSMTECVENPPYPLYLRVYVVCSGEKINFNVF